MQDTPFFYRLDRVDSTNNYAMARIHEGLAAHGMAWFAFEQSAGKGQKERKWQSEPGMNIAMSVVLQPHPLKPDQQFHLNAVVALACHEFFSGFAGTETRIKWPNDLYWRDRKAGGVMIENVLRGTHWKFCIVGMGININQVVFDESLPNPVSLKQITGSDYDVQAMAQLLHSLLMKKVGEMDTRSFSNTLEEYNHNLYAKGKTTRLKKNNTIFESQVKGVSATGQLVTQDEVERHFSFGEVEWLL